MNRAEFVRYFENDTKLQSEVIKILLNDSDFKKRLAEEVFGMPLQDIGINVPGTVGEFVLEKNR